MRVRIGSPASTDTLEYDIPRETIGELLEPFDATAIEPIVGQHGIEVSWHLALTADTIRDSEGERERRLYEDCATRFSSELIECVIDLLELVELPDIVEYRLQVASHGIAGRANYHLTATWTDREGIPLSPQPNVVGGMMIVPVLGQRRLTLGQFRVLEEINGLTGSVRERDNDRLAPERVRAAIAACPEGVRFDRLLERNRVRQIERFKPRIIPRGSHFEVEPTFDGLPSTEVLNYFYDTPASRYGESPIKWRAEDGTREVALVSDTAAEGLRALRQRHVLNAEQVAQALSHPEKVFGGAVDLSEFSERVVGIGVPIMRATPLLREIQRGQWWDWTAEASLEPVLDTSSDTAPEKPNDISSTLDLRDADIRASLVAALAHADKSGDTFIPNPAGDGFLQLSAELRDAVAAADELAAASSSDGKLRKRPREVLQVRDNFMSLSFDRTRPGPPPRLARDLAPPNLVHGTSLHPHQQEGFEWLWALYYSGADEDGWRGALLADDMGVGKTLQVLSFLSRVIVDGSSQPQLIVAPVGLLGNWLDEARRFFGGTLEPITIVTGQEIARHGQHAATFLNGLRIVLTGYETLRSHERTFARVKWNVVVLDEAQKAKNPGSQISRVVRTLHARFRLAMTGTPVENSLSELWTLYDWALPGLLGSLREFNDAYIRPIRDRGQAEHQKLAEQLYSLIAPVFMRRMKNQIADKLPECRFHGARVPLSARQAEAYANAMQTPAPLARLQQLFAVCAHPNLVDGELELPSSTNVSFPKLDRLWAVLDDVNRRGEKAIIFCNRKRLHRWLKRELDRRYDLQVHIVDGDINCSRQRMDKIRQFAAHPAFNVIVLSTRAAGVGLNVTAANHVVHYTREWNPAVENQATDRAYRLGQTRTVHVHTFLATSPQGDTVEITLDRLLSEKRQLMTDFVVPMGGFELKPSDLTDTADRT